MAIEKQLLGRIIHKHDIEENWDKATGFIPKKGEIIVYDIDDNYEYERIKIGDGATPVPNLPFHLATELDKLTRAVQNLESNTLSVSQSNEALVFVKGLK